MFVIDGVLKTILEINFDKSFALYCKMHAPRAIQVMEVEHTNWEKRTALQHRRFDNFTCTHRVNFTPDLAKFLG